MRSQGSRSGRLHGDGLMYVLQVAWQLTVAALCRFVIHVTHDWSCVVPVAHFWNSKNSKIPGTWNSKNSKIPGTWNSKNSSNLEFQQLPGISNSKNSENSRIFQEFGIPAPAEIFFYQECRILVNSWNSGFQPTGSTQSTCLEFWRIL